MNEKIYTLIMDEIKNNVLNWFYYEAKNQNLKLNLSEELINSLKKLNNDIILDDDKEYFLYKLFDFFKQFNEEKLSKFKIAEIVNDVINNNIEIKNKLLTKINNLKLDNIKESIFENLKNKEVFDKEFNYKYISDNKKNQLLENIDSEILNNLEIEIKIKDSLIEKINNNEIITLFNIIKRRKIELIKKKNTEQNSKNIELNTISKECLSDISFCILNEIDSIFLKEKNTEFLNIINNKLQDIEIKINGEKKSLKDFHNEIFNSENFNTNLNRQLEKIHKIFDEYKIPKINIEYFKFLLIQELFSNTNKIHPNITSDECDKIIKDNEKFLFFVIVKKNNNSYKQYVTTYKYNSMYYKDHTYGILSSIIEKIRTLLTDDKKKEFNEDFKIFDEIQKEIDSCKHDIGQEEDKFKEFRSNYMENNKDRENDSDIKKNIKLKEREIMKIKEELENDFTDEKKTEYINKYNEYLKYFYDKIYILIEETLFNKECEKFSISNKYDIKNMTETRHKLYDLMEKIINFTKEKSMIKNLLDLLNDNQKKELNALLEKLKDNEEKIIKNETKFLENSKLEKYDVYEKSILQKIQDLKNNELNNDEKNKLYDYLKDFYEKLISFDINDAISNSITQYINSEDNIIKIENYLNAKLRYIDPLGYIHPSVLPNLKQEMDKKPPIEILFKENNNDINSKKTKSLKFNKDVAVQTFGILDIPEELKKTTPNIHKL